RAILGSAGRAIFRSADRLMTTHVGGVYRAAMRLGRFRLDPLKVDWFVAVVLLVVGELEVWLGSGSVTHHHRVAIGAGMAVLAALVAVRRVYPGLVGIAAALVANAVAGIWAPPSSASYGVAWMCSMYALAAWASRRLFVVGVAALAVP